MLFKLLSITPNVIRVSPSSATGLVLGDFPPSFPCHSYTFAILLQYPFAYISLTVGRPIACSATILHYIYTHILGKIQPFSPTSVAVFADFINQSL